MKKRILIWYFGGIVLGTLICNFILRDNSIPDYLVALENNKTDFFCSLLLVARKRIIVCFILLAIGMMPAGNRLFNIIIGYYGIIISFALGKFVMADGIKGIFLFLLTIMPQYLLYTAGVAVIIGSICTKKKENVKKVFLVTTLFIIGIVVESYMVSVFLPGKI